MAASRCWQLWAAAASLGLSLFQTWLLSQSFRYASTLGFQSAMTWSERSLDALRASNSRTVCCALASCPEIAATPLTDEPAGESESGFSAVCALPQAPIIRAPRATDMGTTRRVALRGETFACAATGDN